jgi:hypothetical protein
MVPEALMADGVTKPTDLNLNVWALAANEATMNKTATAQAGLRMIALRMIALGIMNLGMMNLQKGNPKGKADSIPRV